jgi:hypothetical protein
MPSKNPLPKLSPKARKIKAQGRTRGGKTRAAHRPGASRLPLPRPPRTRSKDQAVTKRAARRNASSSGTDHNAAPLTLLERCAVRWLALLDSRIRSQPPRAWNGGRLSPVVSGSNPETL